MGGPGGPWPPTSTAKQKKGPSKNFVIVDHPKKDRYEWELKYLIIGGVLDLLEKSSETREVSYKLPTTFSILDLLNIFSEVIVASKYGPLARIEKRAMS